MQGFVGICAASGLVKGVASNAMWDGSPIKSFAQIIQIIQFMTLS